MNTIRITSGAKKGRIIETPGGATHPMGERERLALFNMISEELQGAEVLDAFAGSGALGIEALSRGAKAVTFVEKNPEAVKVIRKNLADLDMDANVVLVKVSSFQASKKYDIILADPPYESFDLNEVNTLITMTKKGGTLVLSHPNEAPSLDTLSLIKTHKYARARISIYKNAE